MLADEIVDCCQVKYCDCCQFYGIHLCAYGDETSDKNDWLNWGCKIDVFGQRIKR